MEATLKISVCCFNDNRVHFTFEDIKTGERAGVETTLDDETIDKLTRVVWPCSYYGAVLHDKQTEAKEEL